MPSKRPSEVESPTSRVIPLYIALGAGLLGILVSAYLTYAQFSLVPGVCSINRWFNCDAVLTSSYSKILGIPMAVFGLTWFLVSTALCVALLEGKQLTRHLLLWGVLGIAGVVYLNYVELMLLQTVCLYCLSGHILGIVILAAAILYARGEGVAS